MRDYVNIHPDTKWCILGLYLTIDKKRNKVTIRKRKLLRVAETTLRAQTNNWYNLRALLFFCKGCITQGQHIKEIKIKGLAKMQPEEIVITIIRS
jgi:hypothetical protein